jgi:hypothetical protein
MIFTSHERRLGKPWETAWMDKDVSKFDQNTRNSASNEGGNRLHGYFGTSIFRLFKPIYELALFFAGHISAILKDNILFGTRQRPKCDATTGKANACLMRMGSTIRFRIWFASLGACMAEKRTWNPYLCLAISTFDYIFQNLSWCSSMLDSMGCLPVAPRPFVPELYTDHHGCHAWMAPVQRPQVLLRGERFEHVEANNIYQATCGLGWEVVH